MGPRCTIARHLPVHTAYQIDKSSLGKAVTMHACMQQQQQQRSGIQYGTYSVKEPGLEGGNRRPKEKKRQGKGRKE